MPVGRYGPSGAGNRRANPTAHGHSDENPWKCPWEQRDGEIRAPSLPGPTHQSLSELSAITSFIQGLRPTILRGQVRSAWSDQGQASRWRRSPWLQLAAHRVGELVHVVVRMEPVWPGEAGPLGGRRDGAGKSLYRGEGVGKNLVKAFPWYSRAAAPTRRRFGDRQHGQTLGGQGNHEPLQMCSKLANPAGYRNPQHAKPRRPAVTARHS